MAKSDFDIEDQEYDVVYDDSKKKGHFFGSKTKKQSERSSAADKAILDNLNSSINTDNSSNDLGDFSSVSSGFNNNVVFEEKSDMTTVDKIKDYIDTINVRALVVIAGIFLIVFVIVFMVVLSIVKSNKAYTADIIIPDIVYMGETSNIHVLAKYTGQTKPKKDITNTESVFSTDDNKTLYILNEKIKGSSPINTIIPIQEGRTVVNVTSKLDGRTIGSAKKEVVVCPAFDNSLVQVKRISVMKGSVYDLKIDFGEEECARGVTYSSSNEDIAKVDENGSVTGVKVGKSILTMRRGTRSISITIEVTDKYVSLQSFKVIPTDLQLSIGEKYRLKVDYFPSNATNFHVNYYSNDEKIIKVSDGGVIEALSAGSTTIRVVSSSVQLNTEVSVVVKDNNDSTAFATNMSLDHNEVKLVQGSSRKIKVILTPKSVSNNVVSWKSSDDNIASVTSDGIIFAKNAGTAVVTASTDNGISREVKVVVSKMEMPVIASSDGIETDNWHTKPYVLSFSGSDNGTIYYYGDSTDQMNFGNNKLTISSDENKTYYVRSCTLTCRETCTEKRNNDGFVQRDSNGDPIQVCSTKCSDKPSVCSDPAIYVSKLDRTKPQINAVAGIDSSPTHSDTVQISIVDNMSLVQKWCVTNKNSYGSCKWKTIQTSVNPVVEYTALSNGIYYVFAKDAAGNMSNSYKFEITNIE